MHERKRERERLLHIQVHSVDNFRSRHPETNGKTKPSLCFSQVLRQQVLPRHERLRKDDTIASGPDLHPRCRQSQPRALPQFEGTESSFAVILHWVLFSGMLM